MASADAPASIAVPKTQEQLERIDESVRNNILFSSLSADQLQMIFDAMAEKRYAVVAVFGPAIWSALSVTVLAGR